MEGEIHDHGLFPEPPFADSAPLENQDSSSDTHHLFVRKFQYLAQSWDDMPIVEREETLATLSALWAAGVSQKGSTPHSRRATKEYHAHMDSLEFRKLVAAALSLPVAQALSDAKIRVIEDMLFAHEYQRLDHLRRVAQHHHEQPPSDSSPVGVRAIRSIARYPDAVRKARKYWTSLSFEDRDALLEKLSLARRGRSKHGTVLLTPQDQQYYMSSVVVSRGPVEVFDEQLTHFLGPAWETYSDVFKRTTVDRLTCLHHRLRSRHLDFGVRGRA